MIEGRRISTEQVAEGVRQPETLYGELQTDKEAARGGKEGQIVYERAVSCRIVSNVPCTNLAARPICTLGRYLWFGIFAFITVVHALKGLN